jgi:hypothetical protein
VGKSSAVSVVETIRCVILNVWQHSFVINPFHFSSSRAVYELHISDECFACLSLPVLNQIIQSFVLTNPLLTYLFRSKKNLFFKRRQVIHYSLSCYQLLLPYSLLTQIFRPYISSGSYHFYMYVLVIVPFAKVL